MHRAPGMYRSTGSWARNVVRVVPKPPVDCFDTFRAKTRRLLARDVRNEPSVRAHDAPPRDAVRTRREQRAHRTRTPRVPGFVGDPPVRERVAGWELGEDAAHGCFELHAS